jgi:hypothetical protein
METSTQNMTEDEFVGLMRAHFESLFPKTCRNFQRSFPTLRDYVLTCKPAGPPDCYDANLKDWSTTKPIGAVVQATCPCGNSLALGTEGMSLVTMHLSLDWIRVETERRGLSSEQLIDQVRARNREQILSETSEEERIRQ